MMSTIAKWLLIATFTAFAADSASAQRAESRVNVDLTVDSGKKEIAVIAGPVGGFGPRTNPVLFIDRYADATNLAARIKKIRFLDGEDREIESKKISVDSYTPVSHSSSVSYSLSALPPANLITAPHVSWVGEDFGLVKLYDVLPESMGRKMRVKLDLPTGWTASTADKLTGRNTFETDDYSDSVYLVGKSIRNRVLQTSGTNLFISLVGDWQFEDELVAEMTREIFDEYVSLFGKLPRAEYQINLLPFPTDLGIDRWRAQTQGGTITIVSSRPTSKSRAEQLLHEQLRHELFHLWIPESINLEGDYAWFYEGFARYQALKTGVWVGRIGFSDYLRTLSESIDIANSDNSNRSIIEQSKAQWNTGPGVLAARGMTIAFLTDVRLLEQTKGKLDISRFLAGILKKDANGSEPQIANTVLERRFGEYRSLADVFERHVAGTEDVDWSKTVDAIGLTVIQGDAKLVLIETKKPSRKQRALLNKLGYNRWKKFVPHSD